MNWRLFLPRFLLVCLWLACLAYPLSFLVKPHLLTKPTSTASPTASPSARALGTVETGTLETVVVTRVVDGDTIKISRNGSIATIRLIGINAPESVAPNRPVECYGKESSASLRGLLEGQPVQLENDLSQQDVDRYGRLLRYVYLLDGTFVNDKMIRDGDALEYTYDRPYRYQSPFKAAQAAAKTEQKGLWKACSETLPAFGETSVK